MSNYRYYYSQRQASKPLLDFSMGNIVLVRTNKQQDWSQRPQIVIPTNNPLLGSHNLRCKSNIHISIILSCVFYLSFGGLDVWGHGKLSVISILGGEPMIACSCRSSICGWPTVGIPLVRIHGLPGDWCWKRSCDRAFVLLVDLWPADFGVAWVRNLGSQGDWCWEASQWAPVRDVPRFGVIEETSSPTIHRAAARKDGAEITWGWSLPDCFTSSGGL